MEKNLSTVTHLYLCRSYENKKAKSKIYIAIQSEGKVISTSAV